MCRPVAKSKPASSKASARSVAQSRCPAWLMAVLLGLVTVALYWPATRHDFVSFDDPVYIRDNLHVQAGLTMESIKWAFFHPEVRFGYWHPLTLLSHMLDCQMYGLKPWGHHLTSVLLHAINTMLVFLLLRRLTGATWRSVAVAALFGWHPLRVESVAWISERKDVLSAFFGLLSLLFYAGYARSGSGNGGWKVEDRKSRPSASQLTSAIIHSPSSRWQNYALSLFFFALGLMSKPMLVTWPFVMLLLDYWPLKRVSGFGFRISGWWRLLGEKIPFFALVAAVNIVTFVISKQAGVLAPGENYSLADRGGNALISYCRYLGKLCWPTKLAVFYPHPGNWPVEQVAAAAVFLLVITVFSFAQRRRYPFVLTGWLWYAGMLVPVSGLVQVGDFAMADRFTYLPSLGVLIVLTWWVCELSRGWRYRAQGLSVAGAAAIVLCMALTRQQLGHWQDGETLSRYALKVTENNYTAHIILGNALIEKGRTDEAIREFQEALRLKPDYTVAHYNLGIALARGGQIDEAVSQYQEAIRLSPDYAEAHNNLGVALASRGQVDEAVNQYQEAIRLEPDYAEAYNNLGGALNDKGQVDGAIRQFQEAIHLKPDFASAHYNLGFVLASKGQVDGAIRQYQVAIRLKPDYAKAYNNLGIALLNQGQIDRAIRQFQEALRLKPDFAGARDNLARALEIKNAPAGK
jgi:tetratricopeptide (TPR) repeat protein